MTDGAERPDGEQSLAQRRVRQNPRDAPEIDECDHLTQAVKASSIPVRSSVVLLADAYRTLVSLT